MKVKKRSGNYADIDISNIRKQTIEATKDLPNTSAEELELEANINFFDGMETSGIQKILIKTAFNKVDVDTPNWSYVAGRLINYDLYHSIKRIYKKRKESGVDIYKVVTFQDYYDMNKDLLSYNLDNVNMNKIEKAIVSDRDKLLSGLGVQTLLSRYCLKRDDNVVELIQHLFMSLALFLSSNEDDRTAQAIEYYNVMSTLEFLPATPTLANGRKKDGNCMSCAVGSTNDSIEGIFDTFKEQALGSKFGTGFGWDWSRVRALGGTIRGVSNASGGLIPWMKLENDLSIAVNQLGVRNGAISTNIETWHKDIFDYLDLKRNAGEEKRMAKELFISVSCSDVFMQRVKNNEDFTLFDPVDVPDLTETYGTKFEEKYEKYESRFRTNPESFSNKPVVVNAKKLWKKIQSYYWETGMPFLFFKDTANNLHKNKDLGVIRSTNLCVTGETLILTKEYGYVPILKVEGLELELWNGEEWSKSKIVKTGKSRIMYKIHFRDGTFIEATPYHKWYKEGDDNPIRTKDLKKGDIMQSPYITEAITHGRELIEKPEQLGFMGAIRRKSVLCSALGFIRLVKGLDIEFRDGVKGSKVQDYRLNFNMIKFQNYLEVPSSDYRLEDRISWLRGFIFGCLGIHTDSPYRQHKSEPEFAAVIPNIPTDIVTDVLRLLDEVGLSYSVYKVHSNLHKTSIGILARSFEKYYYKYKLPITIEVPKIVVDPNFRSKNKEITNVERIDYEYNEVGTYCATEPNKHRITFNGVVTGNCTEIFQPAHEDRTILCNLGSLNLSKVNTTEDLSRVIPIAIRMLDNVIDLNNYVIPKSRDNQLYTRAVGLGVAGEAELLATKGIMFGSEEHAELLHSLYGDIERLSDKASEDLGKLKGTVRGSKYRNLYRRAIAPTSSVSIIMDTTSNAEPVFAKKWTEDNMLGAINVVPPNINVDTYAYYISAYDVDQKDMVKMTAIRQKYIDQGISHTLFFRPDSTTGKDVFETIMLAHSLGLKSLYYLRSESPKLTESTRNTEVSCFQCSG